MFLRYLVNVNVSVNVNIIYTFKHKVLREMRVLVFGTLAILPLGKNFYGYRPRVTPPSGRG